MERSTSAHADGGERMTRLAARLLRWLAIGVAAIVVAIFAVRGWQAVHDPSLTPWHTFAPAEAGAEAIAEMDWDAWLAQEDALFEEVRVEVVEPLAPEYHTRENRYFSGSPLYPPGFAVDWNRSYVLEPDGAPRGAAVLVHGQTDSRYRMRHVAEFYSE
jgi:hypothetical protein